MFASLLNKLISENIFDEFGKQMTSQPPKISIFTLGNSEEYMINPLKKTPKKLWN